MSLQDVTVNSRSVRTRLLAECTAVASEIVALQYLSNTEPEGEKKFSRQALSAIHDDD